MILGRKAKAFEICYFAIFDLDYFGLRRNLPQSKSKIENRKSKIENLKDVWLPK